MQLRRTILTALATALALGAASPAFADRDDWRWHEWRDHGWRDHGWREHAWRERAWRERHGYYPPPVYAPPPAYGGYYVPPPVYYGYPGVSFGFTVR